MSCFSIFKECAFTILPLNILVAVRVLVDALYHAKEVSYSNFAKSFYLKWLLLEPVGTFYASVEINIFSTLICQWGKSH